MHFNNINDKMASLQYAAVYIRERSSTDMGDLIRILDVVPAMLEQFDEINRLLRGELSHMLVEAHAIRTALEGVTSAAERAGVYGSSETETTVGRDTPHQQQHQDHGSDSSNHAQLHASKTPRKSVSEVYNEQAKAASAPSNRLIEMLGVVRDAGRISAEGLHSMLLETLEWLKELLAVQKWSFHSVYP